MKKNAQNLAYVKKMLYLCTVKRLSVWSYVLSLVYKP